MIWQYIQKNWKIHKAGYPFILISFIILLFFSILLGSIFFIIFLFITLAIVLFFRIPERTPINDDNIIVSSGCGQVDSITSVELPQEFPIYNPSHKTQSWTKISVFLSVLDVHVNRIPTDSVIKNITYIPGKFFNAQLDKASKDNERQIITLETKSGSIIYVVQIAGLIARRIMKNVHIGQTVKQAQEFGFIRFGSRIDIYLPKDHYVTYAYVGQRAIDGETIFARFVNNPHQHSSKTSSQSLSSSQTTTSSSSTNTGSTHADSKINISSKGTKKSSSQPKKTSSKKL